jgi:hypothetical protein
MAVAVATAPSQGKEGQAPPKFALDAALVLSPEFCETKFTKGSTMSGKETFEVGKAACESLEPALKTAFSNLARVDAESASGSAQVVLLPRFVDVGATRTVGAFSDRELIVLVEWTAKDAQARTVWIATVQGAAKRNMGNVFTAGKNRRRIVEDSLKDLAKQSAAKMLAAQEIRDLVR